MSDNDLPKQEQAIPKYDCNSIPVRLTQKAIRRFILLTGKLRMLWLQMQFEYAIDPSVSLAASARFDLGSNYVPRRAIIDIREGTVICEGAILAPFGGSIRIGRNAYIGPYSIIYGHGGVTIGDDTLIAGHVVIVSANHIFSSDILPIRLQGESKAGIQVGKNVWIGAGARILDGVSIGDGSIVAAGAVVTRSVAPNSIARGVPARATQRSSSPRSPRPTGVDVGSMRGNQNDRV